MENKGNIIYAYKRLFDEKIVYVGQTTNLNNRHREHIKYEPYNEKRPHYNFPLSRAIRKYGEDQFELIVLEDNIDKRLLNKREKYWIQYYNTFNEGYNQTIGGTDALTCKISDEIIDQIINLLKTTDLTYNEISEKTGVSVPHISGINTGAKRKRDDIEYPIRLVPCEKGRKNTEEAGRANCKISEKVLIDICNDILYTEKTFKEIAEKYNISTGTMSVINNGKKDYYRLDQYDYPLRKKSVKQKRTIYTDEEIEKIYDYIISHPQETYKEIAEKNNLKESTVRRIGCGEGSFKLKGKNYPARNTKNIEKKGLH